MNLRATKRRDESRDAQIHSMRRMEQTRLWAGSPLGFNAGDSNLYRYVGNEPTNAIDPSGLEVYGDGGYLQYIRDKELERKRIIEDFKSAAAKNKVDLKIVQQILDGVLKTPKPSTINPCKKWAETVDGKMPPRKPSDEIVGASGVFVGQVAWTYEPSIGNLWGLFADGHFAIRVKFPDGQVFYFDDGNWGGAFREKDIPKYAK